MKKLVKVEEVENEGLVALLGENVELFCLNYIYAGKLVGVNAEYVKLENAHIVYETGDFSDPKYKDAQPIKTDRYIMKSAIESFGVTSRL